MGERARSRSLTSNATEGGVAHISLRRPNPTVFLNERAGEVFYGEVAPSPPAAARGGC